MHIILCVCVLCLRGIQRFGYQGFMTGTQMSMSEVCDEHKCVCVCVFARACACVRVRIRS